jgi:glutamyl-tRNA synthetase
MKEADDKRLADLVAPRILKRGGTLEGHADLAAVCALLKSRAATLEVLADSAMLFYKPLERDAAAVKQALEGENRVALEKFVERIKPMQSFTAAEIYGAIKAVMEEMGIKMGPIATPLRVLVCAADRTPQIDRTLELFGKEEVLARIASGLAMAA